MDPFTNNLKFDKPAGTIVIPLIIPPLEELTREPFTLGDHLRRRRIELGLSQKVVAARLGVTASTIWNWEHGWPIRKKFVPQIIQFLGHNPCLATIEESTARQQKIDRYGDVVN